MLDLLFSISGHAETLAIYAECVGYGVLEF
jgi:hypothetical protein